METTDPWTGRAGLFAVFASGSVLLSLHLVHAIGEGEDLWTFLFGILIPMGFAVGLLAGGAWLWRSELSGDHVFRVGSWCLVGGAVLGIGALLTILYQQAEGVVLNDQLFIVVNAVSAGCVVGVIVGGYDVRQRAAQTQAERLNHQLTVLNRVLRHDIRNGANHIKGRVDLLAEQCEDDTHAAVIRQEVDDLVEIGDHARAIERLLRDTDADCERVEVGTLLEEQLDRLRTEFPETEIEASLPEAEYVSAHPLLASAVGNVLDNAVEHNADPTPWIGVDWVHVAEHGTEYVEITVADDGPGIPEDEIEVLDRGYETPLDHTSGLGLWLANWIVTESGGRLRFEENGPDGTTVSLRLEREPPTVSD